ncbi:Carboxynorspermidine decarboxylase [Candidatus Magnetaquicoccaceae bacterium FCR-1]|uniref:Carboxynorspermidine/carboxyspermidine decarboxylase n=1 Tax=Candidatus Magnetaquiglobus chichijimensis TaxID=3141448 RepID=A0ABQ0CAJ5_9PROT
MKPAQIHELFNLDIETPAFLLDIPTLMRNICDAKSMVESEQFKILFSLKCFSLASGLEVIAREMDGFSASSRFEVLLASRYRSSNQRIHMTTPGLHPSSIVEVCQEVDYVSFNSFNQWLRFKEDATELTSCGLRINPQLSFVADERYNPCQAHSKLGVPLDALCGYLKNHPDAFQGIEGIHFHNNCDCTNLEELRLTAEKIHDAIAPLLPQIKWINMGGGYLLNEVAERDPLRKAVNFFLESGVEKVFLEPGAAIVRNAGYMVSSVIDMFVSGGKNIAILDTCINHLPEVYEYQWRPPVLHTCDDSAYRYVLAGATCLAGDVMGEYFFDRKLKIGSRVVIGDVGAYSLVKANMFNGVNLPSLYINNNGKINKIKDYSFSDYLALCGGINYGDF